MKKLFNETHFYGDNIHKAIPHTAIESLITNFGSFLRLHRISQNSLAFQTYPSNKTKRFEHSLGTMKLAGEFFLYLTSNTDIKVMESMLRDFVEDLKKTYILEKPDIEKHYQSATTCLDQIDNLDYFNENTFINNNATFYNVYTPGNIKDCQRFLYAILFQGVRLAGLLHDVGHLPYSHAIEEVIKDLKNDFDYKKQENTASLTPQEQKFLDTVNKYTTKDLALHEEIGLNFLSLVQRKVVEEVLDVKNQYCKLVKNEYLSFCTLSFMVAKMLLGKYKDSTIYTTLKPIISGTMDADRLDYSARDLYNSGLNDNITNFERIFLFMSFVSHNDGYRVAMPTKAIRNVEDFLWKRWRVYSDIVYHHAVSKNALLFSAKLKLLANASLVNANGSTSAPSTLSDDFLEGITQVLSDFLTKANSDSVSDMFLQLDDSWLDRLIAKADNGRHSGVANSLVSLSKAYKTIFKGFYDFKLIDMLVYEEFEAQFKEVDETASDRSVYSDIFEDIETQDKENTKGQAMYNIIDRLRKIKHRDYDTYYKGGHRFFLNSTISHLNNYLFLKNFDFSGKGKETQYTKLFFEQLEERIKLKYPKSESTNLYVVLLANVAGDHGIKDNDLFVVHDDDETPKPFNVESFIKTRLETEVLLTPLFHIYYDVNAECLSDMSESQIREDIKLFLAGAIFDILRNDIIGYRKEFVNES